MTITSQSPSTACLVPLGSNASGAQLVSVGEALEVVEHRLDDAAPETTRRRPTWSEVVRDEVDVDLAMRGLASRAGLEVTSCDPPEDVRVLQLALHIGEVDRLAERSLSLLSYPVGSQVELGKRGQVFRLCQCSGSLVSYTVVPQAEAGKRGQVW